MTVSVSDYVQSHSEGTGESSPGPFITISQQYGCSGESIANIVAAKFLECNNDKWTVSTDKHIVELAKETGYAPHDIIREKNSRQGILHDIFKGLRPSATLNTFDIHQQLANKAKQAAIRGNIIIIGQAASPATADIDNGLRIRLAAPLKWRISSAAAREKISRKDAEDKTRTIDKAKANLEKIYRKINPRLPAFDITIDNSKFADNLIADIIITAIRPGLKADRTV